MKKSFEQMRNKNFELRNIFGVLSVLLLTACEVIPENEQKIPVEMEETNRTTLIVEFSGLKCNNCPNAAEEAHNLKTLYGEKLVVVEMHPASNSLTNGGKPEWDYTCPAADEYYKHWNISALPYGVVNLSQPEAYQEWVAAYQQSAAKVSPIELQHIATIQSDTILQIEVTIENLSQDEMSIHYIAWITEDSIVGPQVMPDGKINSNYLHNHILRDNITDIWGTPIDISATESTTLSLTYTLPKKVVTNNCNIVGIVLNDGEAIQVNEFKLKNIK